MATANAPNSQTWDDVTGLGPAARRIVAQAATDQMTVSSGIGQAVVVPGASIRPIVDHLAQLARADRDPVGAAIHAGSGDRWEVSQVRRGRSLFGPVIVVTLEDGTSLEFPIGDEPLDEGPALLEPITVDEYRDIEAALQLLWEAVEEGDLEDYHRTQLRCLVELLAEDHRDTIPEQTKRHQLVGTMRTVALFSNHEAIRAGFAWWKIGEIVLGANWPNVARVFLDAAGKAVG